MNNTKHSHLITFYKIQVKGKKHYSTPHPDTIRDLLKRFHNIDIGRRWHFQCTHDLEEAGYINRQRRWEKLPGPEIKSLSSIFVLTVKGLQYLIRKGVSGARGLLKGILDWLHKDDRRRPTAKDLTGAGADADREKALRLIKGIIQSLDSRPAGGATPATT